MRQSSPALSHFEEHANYWRDIYERPGVQALIYVERLQLALGWVDALHLPPGTAVLNIGCGAGFEAAALAQYSFHVHAVDRSSAMCELTRSRARSNGVEQHVDVVMADARMLPFRTGESQLALAIGVLPWLHDGDSALAELARVVAPGGHVVISVDNAWRLQEVFDPWRWPNLGRSVLNQQPVPTFRWSPRETEDHLRRANFEKTRSMTLGFGPVTLFRRRLLSDAAGAKLHHFLQRLAFRGVPGLRSCGAQYLVLARKRGG
jgi:SAM-dependent methyltransferase